MRNSRKSGPHRPLIAGSVAAVVLVGAGTYYFVNDGDILPGQTPSAPSSANSRLLDEEKEGSKKVVVLVDGWSKKILDTTSLSYTTTLDGKTLGRDGAETPIHLTPVEEEDLGALAQEAPTILQRAAARMITVDPTLACDGEGCATDSVEIPFEQLSDATSIPGYGVSYEGYGIETVLYKVELFVPEDTHSVVIQAEGYKVPYTIALVEPTGLEEGFESEAKLAEREWHLVGASFGRFFVPDGGWLGAGEIKNFIIPPLSWEDANDETLQINGQDPLLAKGLTVPVDAAAGFTDQQMMFYSSPTTGCGIGVTCVPQEVQVSYTEPEVDETVAVCSVANGEKAQMVFHTRRWNVEYPSPTHQYGVWDGLSPAEFEGATGAESGLFTGTPPLISGAQTLRVSSVEILTGPSATLWNIAGWVAQDGKDKPEDFTRSYTKDIIPEIQEGRFQTC